MSDNPSSLRHSIQEPESLARELSFATVDNSHKKNTGEFPTIQLEMINIDSPDLKEEDKTDEPLFVRVGNIMYTTHLKNARIKMFAYQAIKDEDKKFDPKGRQIVDDFGSIFMVMGTGAPMTRPEIRLSLLIDGDPNQQRELTKKLMREYYEEQTRKKSNF